jgi:hypothetical protein
MCYLIFAQIQFAGSTKTGLSDRTVISQRIICLFTLPRIILAIPNYSFISKMRCSSGLTNTNRLVFFILARLNA